MEIWRDRKAGRLCVSQEKYIEKILHAFCVDQSKPDSTPLVVHFKLDQSTIPGLKVEKLALFYESQSALSLAKNLLYHKRTKHTDVRLNFIRDALEEDRKETTKRDNEEPLVVGEIPSQGGDCCLSDLDLAIYYPK
nr:retrovirus-related Pol polyprotein from transposon TNT 1-94 [Tanacetum cinerariifolium]